MLVKPADTSPHECAKHLLSDRSSNVFKHQAPVVQTLDSTIQRINHYPADKWLQKPIALSTGQRFIQWIELSSF